MQKPLIQNGNSSENPSIRDKTQPVNEHPIQIINELIELYGKNLEFEFSKYIHYPQSLKENDNRKVFLLEARLIDKELPNLFELDKHQELCLHSKLIVQVDQDKQVMHVPMVDFIGRDLNKILDRLKLVLNSSVLKDLYIFDSGRSYHGYGTKLLTQTEWVYFLGTLLLLNMPNDDPIVDSRWIGHSLRLGKCSMRWTKNTPNYFKIPSLETKLNLP